MKLLLTLILIAVAIIVSVVCAFMSVALDDTYSYTRSNNEVMITVTIGTSDSGMWVYEKMGKYPYEALEILGHPVNLLRFRLARQRVLNGEDTDVQKFIMDINRCAPPGYVFALASSGSLTKGDITYFKGSISDLVVKR